MAKPRNSLLDYAAYLIVRLGICLIQALTDLAAVRLVDVLGWLAYRLDGRHRRVADDNLRHAFPNLNPMERDRIVRGSFRHFISVIVETVRLPRKLHAGSLHHYVDHHSVGPFFDAVPTGRAVLIVTGHFGNWELAGSTIAMLGYPLHPVARTLDNPYLDQYLRKLREGSGQKSLAKNGAATKIVRVLQSGGIVATLADQDAGEDGMFVEFFGRPASTHKAVARMALKHRAVLVVAGVPKVAEPLRFRVLIAEVIDPSDYRGLRDAVEAITQRYTSALERLIRQYPEQYFWLHRRWKHQPAAKCAA